MRIAIRIEASIEGPKFGIVEIDGKPVPAENSTVELHRPPQYNHFLIIAFDVAPPKLLRDLETIG